MRAISPAFEPYRWAPPTEEIARAAGIDPVQVLRFDANVPPLPLPTSRPATIASRLARVNEYPHGGYGELVPSIARYADVAPENVVLGAGGDDLILLVARSFAGRGDSVSIPDAPTYPLFGIAAQLAGAEIGEDDPVLTFTCRPNNPTGEMRALPEARPLVVDEAYFEYSGDTLADRLDEGIIVIRTFSKAFGLAGARIGYALASRDVAAELAARQAPAPVSTLSAELALAALASAPDVAPVVEERERLTSALRTLGLEVFPSRANFVFVPHESSDDLAATLLRQGLAVRATAGGLRISVRDRVDDDVLLDALARLLDRPPPVARAGARSVRHVRATTETSTRVRLALDGASRVHVDTGSGLYDHFLEQLAFHGGLDLVLEGTGDDVHHMVEDAALSLGGAIDRALGDRRGIARYGDAVVPMDDALARAAVDLGGRAWAEVAIEPEPGLAEHALRSLAQAARLGLHVEARGSDAHHAAEAAFKAVGRALRTAVRMQSALLPSTKGVL